MSDSQKPSPGDGDHSTRHDWCGASQLHQHLVATLPGYKASRQFVTQFHRLASIPPWPVDGVGVPVVVHVVWHTQEQNISQAQIDSQIAVLNQDFAATNADLRSVPPAFHSSIGTANIRFFLAQRDPNGNPTVGITRTHTAVASFDHNSANDPPDRRIHFTAQGGKDGWPSDRYLNIWVCEQSGLAPLLGYAQFPADLGNLPATDGVVITHTAFGNTGTAKAPFNLGRTGTHEIGHWLDCFHIWGDDRVGCSGSDECNDTPNQAGSNTGRPSFPRVTCDNGPNGDMFMNYMDYCWDEITVMFTKAQVARMHATLLGPRASILGSTFREFILQTGTTLEEVDNSFEFLMTDWNSDGTQDLIAIKKRNTGTNSTEIHVLSGATHFQSFLLHTSTGLHETNDSFQFLLTQNRDVVAIKKSGTGTNSTEVHRLSRASKFQSFTLQTGTLLHETDATFQFLMADWNRDGTDDLISIKKSGTGTKSTEVHILSGASNFQSYLLQTGTPLGETDQSTKFLLTDWNGDGRPDLVAIRNSGTSSEKTGVQILSGAREFQTTLLQTDTALHNTDGTFDFALADWDRTGRPDLVAIKKKNTGTQSTEIHILAG